MEEERQVTRVSPLRVLGISVILPSWLSGYCGGSLQRAHLLGYLGAGGALHCDIRGRIRFCFFPSFLLSFFPSLFLYFFLSLF